jgi:hypothetical protein
MSSRSFGEHLVNFEPNFLQDPVADSGRETDLAKHSVQDEVESKVGLSARKRLLSDLISHSLDGDTGSEIKGASNTQTVRASSE